MVFCCAECYVFFVCSFDSDVFAAEIVVVAFHISEGVISEVVWWVWFPFNICDFFVFHSSS